MKKLILIIACLLTAPNVTGAIVNNSTVSPTTEDSLSLLFFSLDSLGNPTIADSVFILISAANGNVAYRDSMATTDGRIGLSMINAKPFYWFRDQVSNLDGSGLPGVYSLTVMAKRNAGNLLTPNVYSFQIVSRELSDQLARIGDSVYVKGGVIDTNLTQGGAVSDSASIASWVWNAPQCNHVVAGTFGDYLDTDVSGISCGSGAYSYSLLAFDSTTAQPLSGVSLAIRNAEQTALIATGRTDNTGLAAFNLDIGSFVVVASSAGYIFEAYDTVIVDGPGVDTLICDRFDPGAPPYPLLCRAVSYTHLTLPTN